MNNPVARRALLALSHPLSIAALLVLLLNDHWWRRAAPSWFTGKIGDFAWLIFAPFLLAAILAWLFPRRAEFVGRVSIVGVGLIFALAKTSPAFHALTLQLQERLIGGPSALRLDPTDLITLPALLIAWWIWQHSENDLVTWPKRGWVLLVLSVLMTMANVPAFYPAGVREIKEIDSALYTADFRSDDGGLTWREDSSQPQQVYVTRYVDWQLVDPVNEAVRYRFTPGVSIERTADGGQTWVREVDLSGEEARVAVLMPGGYMQLGPFDAIIHSTSGNVVVAMGLEGVLVRSSNGEWHWVSVGRFTLPQLNRFEQITALISGEIWLGIALIGLIVASRPVRNRGWSDGVIVVTTILTWIGWAFTLIRLPPAMGGGGPGANLAVLAVPAVVILAAIVGVQRGHQLYQQNHRALIAQLVIAVIGALLYLLPYVLWTQGAVPFYSAAMHWALALTAATLMASFFYMRRYNVSQVSSTTSIQHR